MKLFRTIVSNSIFALNILLLFLVFVRDSLSLPVWLQIVGRLHPVVLHLPIGFLVLAMFMVFFRKGFKKKSFHNFFNFVLYLSALMAAVAAIFGIFLSVDGGYDPTQLTRHLVGGVFVSILSASLLLVSLYFYKETLLLNFMLGITILCLILAGHFGTELTHGANFVWQPLSAGQEEPPVITDSTSLYVAAIQPLFSKKCTSCHNEKKAKGKLILTSLDNALKGGKHGAIWTSAHPDKSEIIKRIQLPEENDDHMPPSGKPQLTSDEINLLYQWIRAGGDVEKPWTKYTDSIKQLASPFMKVEAKADVKSHYPFAFANEDVVASVNTPYCTVSRIALDEPALKVDFYVSQAFDRTKLEALLAVKEQVVFLNLAKMPITDADGKTITQFSNLEKLNINQTGVTGAVLTSISSLQHLKSLSLAGTTVDRKSLDVIGSMSTLREVFLWNTKVTEEDRTDLQQKYPAITWDLGRKSTEVLYLTAPILVNASLIVGDGEGVQLKNNLPGVEIRYTTDGSNPDSLKSKVYDGPIAINGYTLVRARSFKPGWYGSPLAEFYFFKKGFQPESVELLNPAAKDYKGEGPGTLIDTKKGSADNFRETAWLAFREQAFDALFTLPEGPPIGKVTLSYSENAYQFILPPVRLEIRAGDDRDNLKLVKTIVPIQPSKDPGSHVKGIVCDIPPSTYRYIRVTATPVPAVPAWITKKKEKGWVFVDEVIFNYSQ